MSRFVAFLRGVNLGGQNKILKGDLVAAFNAIGLKDVRTYIQSGNILFTSGQAIPQPESIENSIQRVTGMKIRAVLRSSDDIDKVVSDCPFKDQEVSHLLKNSPIPAFHVVFFPQVVVEEKLAGKEIPLGAGEEFRVNGREVYLLLPYGVSRSKLPQFILNVDDSSTMRNWNTVGKIKQILDSQT